MPLARSLRRSTSLFGPPVTRLLAPSLGLALRASVNAVQKRSRRFCPARHRLSRHPCRSPGEVAHLSTVLDAGKNHTLKLKGIFARNLIFQPPAGCGTPVASVPVVRRCSAVGTSPGGYPSHRPVAAAALSARHLPAHAGVTAVPAPPQTPANTPVITGCHNAVLPAGGETGSR